MPYLSDLDNPNLTEYELFHFLRYEENVKAVTRNVIKWAVLRREIIPTRIGKANMFSKRDGLEWLASRKAATARRQLERIDSELALLD